MKFRYAKYGKILRPVISITLRHKNSEIDYQVLVDSGADMCLFDAEVGEVLGIDVKKGEPKVVSGIGGKSSFYYVHKVTIEVGGWPYEIEAGFMPAVAGHAGLYGVVGQRGFFDLFVVKFDLLREEIELKERK
ncbi:MAG TPA: retropepsin-like aspartic protease [Candidatus Paceibacterota bacterium]